ncbi:MAG: site-specific DNA-methyltransferase [Trichodesmium sp.]
MATGIPKTKWNGDYNSTNNDTNLSTLTSEISLSYQGKMPENEILALPTAKVKKVHQIGDEINQLYYGDNLPILLSFLENQDIKGKVKLIYIDPPFATKSVFQSRSQSNAYSDLLGGSQYLEFMRQRLIILREILANDGSIYIHLDDNMAFSIKIIMDEIFGHKNFRSWITRKKCNPKNYTKKTYGNISDFILFYTKSDDYIWNRPFEEWKEERANKEYPYIEPETNRQYKRVPIHAPGTRNGETGKSWRGMNPPPGKHWQFSPQKLDEMDAKGEIYWSKNGNPRRKVYLDKSNGIPVQDIWLDYRDAHNQNIKITGYPTEKNPDLLNRIIQASSNPNDLILDCFSGSGTTLAVASELRRNWIGIDNSFEAIETIIKRLTKGCELMGDFVGQRKSIGKQLSLFDNLPSAQKHIINNFSFYAVESVAEDLKQIIRLYF